MAVITVVAAGDVSWVLARCYDTIMTGTASTDYLRVVHGESRHPDVRIMAVFTDIRRQNMCLVLAGRLNTVVTTDTISGDAYVIEVRR